MAFPVLLASLTTDFLFLQGTFWYHSHYQAQYCDGLRGPFVIYDPNDPHRSLYDVDDGEIRTLFSTGSTNSFLVESTVITLADWYHYVSAQAPLAPWVDSLRFRVHQLTIFEVSSTLL